MTIKLSIILATTFRPTLARAVLSATSQMIDGDELLIVGDSQVADLVVLTDFGSVRPVYCKPGGDWGNLERNVAMQWAMGTHLMFIDDDDKFLPSALEAVRNALTVHPDRPHMFRIINEAGVILWKDKEVRVGNHGTPSFVTPNNHKKLGNWPRGLYEADFEFCKKTLTYYPSDALVWSEAVIYGCRDWIMQPHRAN